VFVLPALTTLISLGFAAQVLNQYRTRGKSHQLAWGLALLFYATAAFPEVMGSLSGWSETDFRIYYLFGAILLVPWLALGTSELLLNRPRTQPLRYAYLAFTVVVSALGVVTVALAGLHTSHLATTQVPINCAMWCSPKSESGYLLANGLAALSAAVGNSIGTLILVGGALYSAVRSSPELLSFKTLTSFRPLVRALRDPRTLGNILILAGAVIVAAIATLTRIGHYELFYAGQTAGVAVIFAGFRVIGAAAQPRRQLA
jgi:hypothetical protein